MFRLKATAAPLQIHRETLLAVAAVAVAAVVVAAVVVVAVVAVAVLRQDHQAVVVVLPRAAGRDDQGTLSRRRRLSRRLSRPILAQSDSLIAPHRVAQRDRMDR